MALSRLHLESLERQLRIHEQRIDVLCGHQNALDSEIGHENITAAASGLERNSSLGRKANQTGETARDSSRKVRSPDWIARQRNILDREIRIHQRLVQLGRDPKVLDALADLAENRDYAREVSLDPKAAARQRGIEIPPNMTLHLDLKADRVYLQIAYYEDVFPFVVSWDSDTGFSSPELFRREARVG
jgi:hypothetical protein